MANKTNGLRGELVIRVSRRGVLVERIHEPNMIMSAAKDVLARLIAGDGAGKTVTRIGFGAGGQAASPDDTGLTNPYIKPLSGHLYPGPGVVRFNWQLAEGEANGMVIRELGLLTADGLLFARKVRAGGIEKAPDISLDSYWEITF